MREHGEGACTAAPAADASCELRWGQDTQRADDAGCSGRDRWAEFTTDNADPEPGQQEEDGHVDAARFVTVPPPHGRSRGRQAAPESGRCDGKRQRAEQKAGLQAPRESEATRLATHGHAGPDQTAERVLPSPVQHEHPLAEWRQPQQPPQRAWGQSGGSSACSRRRGRARRSRTPRAALAKVVEENGGVFCDEITRST